MQALLELKCIPSGMELFPAADDDQWTFIRRVIDDCDYYVLLLGGRYGSISPQTGKSYTHMEYEYAIDKGKPVAAFIHENPDTLPLNLSEETDEGRKQLREFRKQVQTKMCRKWANADQLGAVVSRSITQLINQKPATGWVRADRVADESAAQEIARLRRDIEKLEEERDKLKATALNPGELQQGREYVDIRFSYSEIEFEEEGAMDIEDDERPTYWKNKTTTIGTNWEDIITTLAPIIPRPTSEGDVRNAINRVLYRRRPSWERPHIRNLRILEDYFQIIKVQLRALGFVEVTHSSEFPFAEYWQLTEKGDAYVLQTMAAKKRSEQ